MNLRRERRASVSSVMVQLLMTDVVDNASRIPDGFFDRKLPIQLSRFDHDVEHVRVLLHVTNSAAGAGVIDDLLEQPPADGTARLEPEAAGGCRRCSLTRGRGGVPADAQRAGVAGERFGLQAPAAGPGSQAAPRDRPLGW